MIGREEEIKYLRSLKSEEESQFIAIYGRRRIGKGKYRFKNFDEV